MANSQKSHFQVFVGFDPRSVRGYLPYNGKQNIARRCAITSRTTTIII